MKIPSILTGSTEDYDNINQERNLSNNIYNPSIKSVFPVTRGEIHTTTYQ